MFIVIHGIANWYQIDKALKIPSATNILCMPACITNHIGIHDYSNYTVLGVSEHGIYTVWCIIWKSQYNLGLLLLDCSISAMFKYIYNEIISYTQTWWHSSTREIIHMHITEWFCKINAGVRVYCDVQCNESNTRNTVVSPLTQQMKEHSACTAKKRRGLANK